MIPRHRLPTFAAVLALPLIAGAVVPASAQTGVANPQAVMPVPEVVPPSAAAPSPALRLPLAVGHDVQLLTLDFADGSGGGVVSATGATSSDRGPVGRFFDSIAYWTDYIFTTVTRGLTPPSPETFAKSMRSKDPNDFWKLVGDAGYKLKEISTDVGVVPDVGFRFKYVRELSDGDVNWLERKLDHHADKFGDPLSVIQRTIIYTLLSVNSSDMYYVDELKVKLLPLPKAEFSLMPWDSGLSEEHDTLLRAIQGKKRTKRKPTEEDSHY